LRATEIVTATSAIKAPRRRRPEDGGIVWHERIHAFECLGCGEFEDVRSRRRYEDPEWVARAKELLIVDHTECWKFDDPKMAADARRYRKQKKLRENLARENLAAQRVSWRGRNEF